MLEQVDILEVKLKLDHAQCTLVNTPLSARAHLERITKDYRSTNEISHGRFCKCLHLFFLYIIEYFWLKRVCMKLESIVDGQQ